MRYAVVLSLLSWPVLVTQIHASELDEGKMSSKIVPSPVEYSVVLPDGYDAAEHEFPLLLVLHSGTRDHTELAGWKSILDELWAEESLPGLVAAMPSAGETAKDRLCQYADFKDGTEKWESFVTGPFLDHIRNQYNVTRSGERTAIIGASMGGLGALRIVFKRPEEFGGVAAIAPGIMPAYCWNDVQPRNRFFMSDQMLKRIHGAPIDKEHWAGNNPATIAKANPDRLRRAGLQIYIECGDEDCLSLHEGTEFMHATLWNLRIPHEYHLVRGGDHGGRTIRSRGAAGLRFLNRVFNPPGPDPDAALKMIRNTWDGPRQEAEKRSPPRLQLRLGEDQMP